MLTGFIDDGYTREGVIEGKAGLYPPLKIEFRPLVSHERVALFRRIDKADDGSVEKSSMGERLAAEMIAERVSEWDLKDGKGETVTISADNAMRLHPQLAGELFLVIVGNKAPAVDDDQGN